MACPELRQTLPLAFLQCSRADSLSTFTAPQCPGSSPRHTRASFSRHVSPRGLSFPPAKWRCQRLAPQLGGAVSGQDDLTHRHLGNHEVQFPSSDSPMEERIGRGPGRGDRLRATDGMAAEPALEARFVGVQSCARSTCRYQRGLTARLGTRGCVVTSWLCASVL